MAGPTLSTHGRLAAYVAQRLLNVPSARLHQVLSALSGTSAVKIYVDDYPDIVTVLDEARRLADDPHRPTGSLLSRAGLDQVVVIAHRTGWSLVGSSAGPVFVLPDWSALALRIDHDQEWAGEIGSIVERLVEAAGSPPVP
ncbi:MAG: hypothetical protein JXA67_19705 [Micromonosporaceae bacterium]|nr:hypothetical protein [Micromonosporaceae bacterium]